MRINMIRLLMMMCFTSTFCVAHDMEWLRETQSANEPAVEFIDSMELCPFTIEVYPETLHIGDILHIKMSFENKSDMITWALPKAISTMEVQETNIVSFIFQDDKTGIQYSWNFKGGYLDYPPKYDVW